MKLITLYLPEPDIKALDSLVERGYYPNRAETIRFAVKDLLKSHLVNSWEENERLRKEEKTQAEQKKQLKAWLEDFDDFLVQWTMNDIQTSYHMSISHYPSQDLDLVLSFRERLVELSK